MRKLKKLIKCYRRYGGYTVVHFNGWQLSGFSNEQLNKLTKKEIAGFSNEQLSWFSKEQISMLVSILKR